VVVTFLLPKGLCPQKIKPYPKITQLHMTWNKVSFYFQKRRLMKWWFFSKRLTKTHLTLKGFERILVILYLSLGGILPFVS
jgi:hypothetical protein